MIFEDKDYDVSMDEISCFNAIDIDGKEIFGTRIFLHTTGIDKKTQRRVHSIMKRALTNYARSYGKALQEAFASKLRGGK